MQITKETKCLGTKNNMASAKKIQEKDSYKFAPLSDRELEWFDTHKCQTGKTQCANSRRLFFFFFWPYAIYPFAKPFEEVLVKTRPVIVIHIQEFVIDRC